jgi:hypothetical protein
MFMTFDRCVPVKNGIGSKELENECLACTELAENGYQRPVMCTCEAWGSVGPVIYWTG